MTNLTMPNNISSLKYALKPVPGLAAIGVPHGVEDGSRTLGEVLRPSPTTWGTPSARPGTNFRAYFIEQLMSRMVN